MPKFGIRTLYCCVLLPVNDRFKRSQTSGVAGGVVVADKRLGVLPIVQQRAGHVMVGKVADHEYLLVVQCAGVGVNLFIVGQQRGVVTVDEGLVRLTQRQQAAVEAVHRFQVAHLFGCVDLRVVGVQRYPRCAGGKACMSRSYLSDRLHREVHSNLTEYVTLTRIQFAANLLRYHHYTITQAAQEVGIPDVPYFTRLFKRTMGETPSQYAR